MQRKILLIGLFFLLSSCAIHGEVYRLQTRLNNWYKLLDQKEIDLFSNGQIEELGTILDTKELDDADFANKISQLRVNEAIMAFDGNQTAHFFYNVLLKDLVKFSYQEFLEELAAQEQYKFVESKIFSENIFTANMKLESIFDNARENYGMNYFSDIQILNYYRSKSLPATTYLVVYDVLAFLARYRYLDAFSSGQIDLVLNVFSNIEKGLKSRRISAKKQAEKDQEIWQSLRKRSLLTKLSDQEFLILIKDHVLVEMDEEVCRRTLNNIRARFKE